MKEKPKYNIFRNVQWMATIAWKHRKRVLLFCILTASLEVLFNLIQLYIAPGILSCVEQRVSVRQLLRSIGVFTAALFLVQGFKRYVLENAMIPRVNVRCAVIEKIVKKSNMTSYSNTLNERFIKLREKARFACQGNDQATELIWETLTKLLTNIGRLIVYLGILSHVNGFLALVIIATCAASFFAARYANNWRYARRDEEEKYFQQKSYLRTKSESVELAKDIRIFGLQNWLNELLDQIHNLYLDFSLRCERVEVLADITETVLTAARNGIAYVILIQMALREGLSVSEFLLYFTAATTFTTWVMGILQEMSTLHKESLDIPMVREFLDYPEPFRFEDGENVPEAESYELKLKAVSFRYPGAKADTLHDFDLTIHPGEKLAIVGLNGAGKTTLVKLLCGLLDPTKGAVLLNGKDIRNYNRRSYYALFSAVFQEFSILDVTVAEEIAQTTEVIDDERIADCLEKAGLTSTIEKLPNGLDTHIGREVYLDGTLFSGGETQRLMLARALYKDGPILLLDEPTAALDPIAEAEIYSKFDEIAGNKTAIYISHRLSSCKFCNEIAVFHEGRIVQQGSHDALVADANGKYHALWTAQAQYYITE